MRDEEIEMLRQSVVAAESAGFLLFILVITAGFIYFLPLVIAIVREHRQLVAIGALNLLLGWTFIGWVGALVWALVNPNGPHQHHQNPPTPPQ